MSKPTNTIEINGKRYDAQTGHQVSSVVAAKKRGSVDGVIGHKPTTTVNLAAPRLRPAQPIVPISSNKLMDMQPPKRQPHAPAKAANGRTPQGSQTLMRHVVKKPGQSLKRQQIAHGHVDALVTKPPVSVATKQSVSSIPQARLHRAGKIAKSAHISRFIAHKATQSPPTGTVGPSIATAKPARTDQPLDIFENALQHATSHKQPPAVHHKHPNRARFLSKRRVSLAATALSVLLLVGFIGFENRAGLSLRMAATKAGFSAALPGYRPSGFSVGHLNYSAGNVAINFHSNSDQRAFAIIEKPSAWDSTTLRDNFVAAADKQYQTVSVGGRTVYLYGKNNAAWVNGGIWYQVKSDGSLSNDQLTRLAGSL